MQGALGVQVWPWGGGAMRAVSVSAVGVGAVQASAFQTVVSKWSVSLQTPLPVFVKVTDAASLASLRRIKSVNAT